MKFNKILDISLNIFLPILLGYSVYILSSFIVVPALIKNHLADGLWAYAFISSILIIWEREINILWICIAFIISCCFELLQFYHQIPGTGDVYDVLSYFLFFIIALKLNQFFKTQFQI